MGGLTAISRTAGMQQSEMYGAEVTATREHSSENSELAGKKLLKVFFFFFNRCWLSRLDGSRMNALVWAHRAAAESWPRGTSEAHGTTEGLLLVTARLLASPPSL